MGSNLHINNQIETYIEKNSYALHSIQKEIIEYNNGLGEIKRMQIAVSQCQFLHLIIKLAKINSVLEIGTFTGLSAISMSLALPENGSVIALDKNEETNIVAVNFFKKAKQEKKIKTIVKPAMETLKDLKITNKKFDMIFIDADKENYQNYYEESLDLINKDGLIVIDNVLWHGEVADPAITDKFTTIIRSFNTLVADDKRVEQIIVPLGDGFTVCRKL
jgi:predicted O-methyltransferase YrrM